MRISTNHTRTDVDVEFLREPIDASADITRHPKNIAYIQGLYKPPWESMPVVFNNNLPRPAPAGPLERSVPVARLANLIERAATDVVMLAMDTERPRRLVSVEVHNGFCGWATIAVLAKLAGQKWGMGLGRKIYGTNAICGEAPIDTDQVAAFALALGFSTYSTYSNKFVEGRHLTGPIFYQANGETHCQIAVFPDLREPTDTFILPPCSFVDGSLRLESQLEAERQSKIEAKIKAKEANLAPKQETMARLTVPVPALNGPMRVATWAEFKQRLPQFYADVYDRACGETTSDAGVELLNAMKACSNRHRNIDFIGRQVGIIESELLRPGWENTIAKEDIFSNCGFDHKDFSEELGTKRVLRKRYKSRVKTVKVIDLVTRSVATQTDQSSADEILSQSGPGEDSVALPGSDNRAVSDVVLSALRQTTAAVHNGRPYTEPLINLNRTDPAPEDVTPIHKNGRIVDISQKGALSDNTIRFLAKVFKPQHPTDAVRKMMPQHVSRDPSCHPDARAVADAMHAIVWNKALMKIRYGEKDQNYNIVDVGGKRGTAEFIKQVLQNANYSWGQIDFYSVFPDDTHYDKLNHDNWGHGIGPSPGEAGRRVIKFHKVKGYFQDLQRELADSGVPTIYIHNDTCYYYDIITAREAEWHIGSYNVYGIQSGHRTYYQGQVRVECQSDDTIKVMAQGNGKEYQHKSLSSWVLSNGDLPRLTRMSVEPGLDVDVFEIVPGQTITAKYNAVKSGGPPIEETANLARIIAASTRPLDDSELTKFVTKLGPTAQQLAIINARRAVTLAPYRAEYTQSGLRGSRLGQLFVIYRACKELNSPIPVGAAVTSTTLATLMCLAAMYMRKIATVASTSSYRVTVAAGRSVARAATKVKIAAFIAALVAGAGTVVTVRQIRQTKLALEATSGHPDNARLTTDDMVVAQLGAVAPFAERVWGKVKSWFTRPEPEPAFTHPAFTPYVPPWYLRFLFWLTMPSVPRRPMTTQQLDRILQQVHERETGEPIVANNLTPEELDQDHRGYRYVLTRMPYLAERAGPDLDNSPRPTGMYSLPAATITKPNTDREIAAIKRLTLPEPVVDAQLNPEYYYLSNPQTVDECPTWSNMVRSLTIYQPAYDWAKSVSRPALERDPASMRSGPVVHIEQNPVISYSVNHRNPRSLFSALYGRQLNPVVEPDPDTKNRLLEFVASRIDAEVAGFDKLTMPTLEEYLAEKTSWPNSKKNRYRASWQLFTDYATDRQSYDFGTKRPHINCFVKSYEENTTLTRDATARARNIGSLAQEWVFIQFLQSLCLRQQKLNSPDFSYRATVDTYEGWMSRVLSDRSAQSAISTDFSAYDSLQYPWYMDAVDRPVWEAACVRFSQLYPWWTVKHTQVVLRVAVSTAFELRYEHAGVRILTVELTGTPSGHGPKTTDGGSRRNRLMQDFIASHIPLARTHRLITGDDFFLAGPTWYVDAYAHVARSLYNTSNDPRPYGVGWICKKILVQRRPFTFEFVSKVSANAGDHAILLRDPAKMLMNGRYYTGSDRRMLTDPSLHRTAVLMSDATLCDGVPFLEMFSGASDERCRAWVDQHTSVRGTGASRAIKAACNPVEAFTAVMRLKTGSSPDAAEWIGALTAYGRATVFLPKSFAPMVTGSISPQDPRRARKFMPVKSRQKKPKSPKPKQMTTPKKKRAVPSNATLGSTSSAADYLRCLIEPETYTSKIPNPVPVTTHVAQGKGCVSLSTNSDGYLTGWVSPHTNTIITYCNTGVITDSTTYATMTFSSTSSSPLVGYDFRRRVVACVATVELLSPNMTRRGIITGAFMTYQPSTVAGISNDSIRDLPDALTLNAAKDPSVRLLYKPFDPACSDFLDTGAGVNGKVPCLVFAISGAEPNSTVMVKYRAIFECIPTPTMTDLLMPTPGPIGSPNDISSAVASIAHASVNNGLSAVRSATQRAVGMLGNTAGLFMRGAALALPYVAQIALKG